MKTNSNNRGILHTFILLVATLTLLCQAGSTARATSITFSAPATIAGDTDGAAGGGGQLFAYTWGGTATTVNGVSFTSLPVTATGLVGPNLSLAGFSGANASVYVAGVAPFSGLSASYSNLLRGAVFNAGTLATATLTNLTVGHTYFVQLWVGDPRTGATTNRNETLSSGGGSPVTLAFNTTQTNGGLGQFTYATFIADATTQDITIDPTASPTAADSAQINAIQLRDISGVWSGTASATWNETDVNFSGSTFAAVKAGASPSPVVYFGDKDAANAAVANNNITVAAGGVTGSDVVFNNNAITYTIGSADANGISGAYGVTLGGTNTVTFNGANTYSGSTILGTGALLTLGASGSIASSTNLTLGANSTLTVGGAGAIAGATLIDMTGGSVLDTTAATPTIASGKTLRGSGTVRGSLTAASGSSIVLGIGTGNAGTITVTNNLSLDGQAFTFDLGLADSVDKLNVGGVLTMNANSAVTLNTLAAIQANGTYTLLTYASKSGVGNFTLGSGTLPNGASVSINNNPTSVTLTVTGGLTGTVSTWTNLAGGSWTNATNWAGFSIASGTDNIADFSTLDITAPRTVTVNGTRTIGHMLFGDTVQNNNWTLSTGTNILSVSSGSPTIFVNSGQIATISSSLWGTQGFNKFGPGTLTLSTAITNRLTNTTILVADGTLNLNSLSSLGNVGNYTNSVINPSVTVSNATLSLTVGITANTPFPNTLVIAGISNTINQSGSLTGFRNPATNSQVLSGSGVVAWNYGGQLPSLTGPMDSFTGTVIFNGNSSGTCGPSFGFNQEVGFAAPPYGVTGSSNAIFEFHGGPVSHLYNGNGVSTNYMGELRGGDNTVLFAKFNRSGAVTLEVGGLNTSSTFSGSLRNNRGALTFDTPLGLRKVGAGTLTLSGANQYSGPTDVRAGSLLVSGSLDTTFFGGTPVTVQSGAKFELTGTIASPTVNVLSGAQMVVGPGASLGSAAITLNGLMDTTASGGGGFNLGTASLSGSGVITGCVNVVTALNPGPIGAAGTLTVTNGNVACTGGTLTFDLSNTPGSGNDFLDVNGNLDLSTPGVTVSINKMIGSLGSGTYVLAKCSGTLGGSVGNLTLVGANPLDALQFNGNQLELVVSAVPSLTWTGGGAGNLWDIVTSVNWLNGATPSTYTNGNTVTFNNVGGTNPVVNIPGTVTPSVVTVSGSSNYTFVGGGDIAGATALLKSGTGTLTVLNTNTFTGNALISGGTLALGNAGTNGSLVANIATTTNLAAFVFTTPLDQVASNTISGPGSFTKLGAGVLTLVSNSTLTGPTTIGAGTLSLGDGASGAGALGTGNVTNSATLALNRGSSVTFSNAIRNNGGMVNLGLGPVTLAGTISGTGALTNESAGTLYLAASNTYSGGTFIKSGIVTLDNFNGLGIGAVTIDDSGGGALQFRPVSGSSVTVANNIALPAATTQQFMSETSLSTPTTIRLTGVISGGFAASVTRFVDGWAARATISLENPANTFTTIPEVFSGRLAFNSDGALGNAANAINVNVQGSGNRNVGEPTIDGLRFDAGMTLNALREIQLVGTENIDVQGFNCAIAGPVTGLGLIKFGAGTLTVNGPGSLIGTTTVNAGTLIINSNWSGSTVTVASGATLGGNGTIDAGVLVSSGGTLSPGSSIGRLDLNTNLLSLTAGSFTVMEINATSVTCDTVTNLSSMLYNGTLNVNLAGTPVAGQQFKLFSTVSGTNYSGSFATTNLPALGGGLAWQWTGSSGTLAVVASVATNPTNLTFSASGGTLNLSWPSDHLGWRLETQTNSRSVGLTAPTNTWFTVPGAASMTATNLPIDPANPTVFFRLVYP